jgi:hypothetical protein
VLATTGELTEDQREAIATWNSSAAKVTRDSAAADSNQRLAAAASGGVKTLKLFRGGFMMWAEESVQFGYSGDGRTVTWSSAWQNAGAVFPNNVTRLGTRKFLSTSTQHSWRGGYRVGAGVPTPWGNANVYTATSYAESRIKNIGSLQWWLN